MEKGSGFWALGAQHSTLCLPAPRRPTIRLRAISARRLILTTIVLAAVIVATAIGVIGPLITGVAVLIVIDIGRCVRGRNIVGR